MIFYDDESSTPFEVESVVNVDVERTRDKRNCPRLKFGKTETSINVVILQVTNDI